MPPKGRKPVRLASLRELDWNLASLRTDFIKLCVYATLISLFVPVIATVALLASPCYGLWPERAKQLRKVLLLSVLSFVLCFGLPLFCVVQHGGFGGFRRALEHHELSTVEVYSPFLSYFLIQYFIVFVMHTLLKVEEQVHAAKCARRRLAEGVNFESPSTTIDRALTGGIGRSAKVPLSTIIADLEGLPGWSVLEGYKEAAAPDPGPDTARSGEDTERSGSSRRGTVVRRSVLGTTYLENLEVGSEADQARDYGTLGTPALGGTVSRKATFFSEDESAASVHVAMLAEFIKKQGEHIMQTGTPALAIVVLLFLRALLSRLWISGYWGHPFLPQDGLLMAFSLHSIVLTFFVSGLWVVLFVNAVKSYSGNYVELQLVSALVTVQERHVYMTTALLQESKDDAHQFNNWCRKLPHISMGHVENIKAWWMIREYALVDTMDERTTLEIVVFMGITSIMFMTLKCLYDLYLAGLLASDAAADAALVVTSFQVQAVFDLVLIGYLVCLAMLRMLGVNNLLAAQGKLLLQARHYLLLPQASLMSLSEKEVQDAMAQSDDASSLHKLPKSSILASDFLTHLNEVIRFDDFIQTLFGVEVTSFNVAQVVLAMITGLGSAFGSLYVLYKSQHGELAIDHAPDAPPEPPVSAVGAALVGAGLRHARTVVRALRH